MSRLLVWVAYVTLQSTALIVLCSCIYFTDCFVTSKPSVLWRCWLGGRKGIWSVKNWVVGCWCGYFSAARCRLACGPADPTATHCLLLLKVFFCKFDRSFLVTLLTNKQQFCGGSNSTDVLMFFNVQVILGVRGACVFSCFKCAFITCWKPFLLRLCSKNHRVSKMHQLTSIAGLIFVPIAPFLLNKDTLIVALLCIVSVMLWDFL